MSTAQISCTALLSGGAILGLLDRSKFVVVSKDWPDMMNATPED